MENQSESLCKYGCCDTQVHVIAQGENSENTGYPQSNDLSPCAEWWMLMRFPDINSNEGEMWTMCATRIDREPRIIQFARTDTDEIRIHDEWSQSRRR